MLNEEMLDKMLTEPSDALVEDIKKIEGDIMILGAGGKMGPTLSVLAANAVKKAGINKKIYAVSRFSDEYAVKLLEENGITIIKCDLQDKDQLEALPNAENIIYMAGRKFGTDGNEWATWGMNSVLPAYVIDKFKASTFVVFSSGNVYPLVPVSSNGCTESDKPHPIAEYSMSCLARERTFEFAAKTFGTKIFVFRLNFAVDLRYGVLYDIASNVASGKPVSLSVPYFNIIWQGSANEIAIRGLLHASKDVCVMNVTGPEKLSVRETAEKFGKLFGKEPLFEGSEGDMAYLNDSSKMVSLFGKPSVPAETLIEWQAEWIKNGGRALNKPTHFESSTGKY